MVTEPQKRIMAALLAKPLTAEELATQLSLSYGAVMEELKGLLAEKIIDKEGFPTKYRLAESISQKVGQYQQAKEKDPFDLRLHCFIEAEGVSEEIVSKGLAELEKSLRSVPERFTIYRCDQGVPQANGERFHGFLDVELSVKDFQTVIYLLFNYGPVGIEVLKPAQITLQASDLQDALLDCSEWVSRYTTFIADKLKRDEIEQFNRQMYQK